MHAEKCLRILVVKAFLRCYLQAALRTAPYQGVEIIYICNACREVFKSTWDKYVSRNDEKKQNQLV